jgi:hypothetical protein
MANFLTSGREALLTALQGDPAIAALVTRWYAFEGSLLQPYEVMPQDCPAYALYPGQIVEPEQRKEIALDIEQQIVAQITTEGDAPDTCEDLLVLTLERCRLARADMLGLSSSGLAVIQPTAQMTPWRSETDAWMRWEATITIRLRWTRRRYET